MAATRWIKQARPGQRERLGMARDSEFEDHRALVEPGKRLPIALETRHAKHLPCYRGRYRCEFSSYCIVLSTCIDKHDSFPLKDATRHQSIVASCTLFRHNKYNTI